MFSSEEYDKRITDLMRRAGALPDETEDLNTATKQMQMAEKEIMKLEISAQQCDKEAVCKNCVHYSFAGRHGKTYCKHPRIFYCRIPLEMNPDDFCNYFKMKEGDEK